MIKLTDTLIKAAKPKPKPEENKSYTLSDGDKLGLIIKPNGSKLWEVRYYAPITKKRKNISLGAYPAISLKAARRKRDEINELLAKDIDPKEHRAKLRNTESNALKDTLLVYFNKLMELQTHSGLNPKTIEGKRKSFGRHILPALGSTPIVKLTPKMYSDQLAPLNAQKAFTAIKKIFSINKNLMRIAIADGVIEFDKIQSLRQNYPSPNVQHAPTIRPEELPELMRVIKNCESKKATKIAIEWQLRSLTRVSETTNARWEQIDFKNNIWLIEAQDMKANRDHAIPLTHQMLELLKEAKKLNIGNSEFIFQGRDLSKPLCAQTPNKVLRRNGYKGKLTSHGLRSIASTALNEQEFNKDVIESLLSHLDKDQVRRAYNRSEYLEQKRQIMCWWNDFIDNASRGLD